MDYTPLEQMTMRDVFAACALIGCMGKQLPPMPAAELAALAYDCADKMLEARRR